MRQESPRAPKRPTLFALPLLGWKENVSLPRLGLGPLAAKIDTGARTAALHADDIHVHGSRVSFTTFEDHIKKRHVAQLLQLKRIKSSNGHSEMRPVIETEIRLGGISFIANLTLTDRTDMGVPMLLGRDTIKGRFLVNPARSFLQSRKVKPQ